MARPLWMVKLTKRLFPARFRLARWTHLPVLDRLTELMLFKDDDMVCLPKDNVITIRQPILPQEDVVVPSQVVDHFIDRANHLWIMDRCICRDASHCQDYPTKLGCLFLGEAVTHMDPRLGRRVTRAEAHAHVARCREAGLVHMIGRNKLDTVWTGAHPGHKLLTVCNCCPCCCLWKILPDITPRVSSKVTRMPGVQVTVTDACKGCKLCTRDICFVGALSLNGKQAVIGEACRGCGRCVAVCPLDAIELTVEDTRFVEQTIARIEPLVDVT